jgi:hypothetical protein
MKYLLLPLTAVLLPSCGLSNSQKEENALLNRSALYDPPTLTLAEGVEYQFVEGVLTGTGQRFHSQYSYQRALIIGNGGK